MNSRVRPEVTRLHFSIKNRYSTTFKHCSSKHIRLSAVEDYIRVIFSDRSKRSHDKVGGGTLVTFFGRFQIIKSIDSLHIHFLYYLDKSRLLNNKRYIEKKLRTAKKLLSKVWSCKVLIHSKNVYDCLWQSESIFGDWLPSMPKNSQKRKTKFLDFKFLNKLFFQVSSKKDKEILSDSVKKLYSVNIAYRFFLNSFIFMHNNDHFIKLNKVIYCCFAYRYVDVKIITESIAYTLSKLRQGHIFFFQSVKEIFKIIFSNQRTLLYSIKKILGLSLIFKGRLILKNRQTPRKKKFILSLGEKLNTLLQANIASSKSIAICKLGVINVSLSFTYLKSKVFNLFCSNNLTMVKKSLKLISQRIDLLKVTHLNSLRFAYSQRNSLLNFQIINNYIRYRLYVQFILSKKSHNPLSKIPTHVYKMRSNDELNSKLSDDFDVTTVILQMLLSNKTNNNFR